MSIFIVTKVNCVLLYPTILFELILNRCVYVSNFVEMYIMLSTIKKAASVVATYLIIKYLRCICAGLLAQFFCNLCKLFRR